MKAISCAVIALVCVVGLVVADFGYGSYGSYGASYMPIPLGGGSKGGFGDGGLLMLLGFLFLIMFLFGGFNQDSSKPSVSVVDLRDD